MSFTNNRLQSYWPEASAFIKKTWPKFNDADLKIIDGRFDKFLAVLKDLYGDFPRKEAEARVAFQKFLNEMDSKNPEGF